MISANDKTIRCAIYTRKSTDENLQLDFNSLDAQRESAEAYITSQKHAGWVCLGEHYDDGGYTGGNIDRPAFQRMGHVTRARVTQIMNLLHLAPDIQEELLHLPRVTYGKDPIPERHVRAITAIPEWWFQRTAWRSVVAGKAIPAGGARTMQIMAGCARRVGDCNPRSHKM